MIVQEPSALTFNAVFYQLEGQTMAKVTVNIASTVDSNQPSWKTFGGYLYKLSGKPDQVVNALSAIFNQVPSGDVTISAQMVDADQIPYGPIASAPITITDPGVVYQAPSNLSFNQVSG